MKHKLFLLCLVVFIGATMSTTGCKKMDFADIRGNWSLGMGNDFNGCVIYHFSFNGGKEEGTVTCNITNTSGTYRVFGDEVEFEIALFYQNERFIGSFNGEDQMNGTWVLAEGDLGGTWFANRK